MASVRLPLAKPVQEMVIPEVGSREAKSMPMASKGLSAKNIFPMAKPMKGVMIKLINSAVPCNVRLPFFSSSLMFRVIIIG